MAEDAWIGEERLSSGEGMQIGSAHADAVNSHQGLAWTGRLRSGELFLEGSRLLEYDLSHESDGTNLPVEQPRASPRLQLARAIQFAGHTPVHQIHPHLLMGALQSDVVQHGSVRPVGSSSLDAPVLQSDQVYRRFRQCLVPNRIMRLRRWLPAGKSASQLHI